jgi:hypothetical protein
MRYSYGDKPVEQIPLKPADRIRLGDGGRNWWTVQAVSEHYTACVQQAPFKPKGTLQYTVLDWRNGVRGPCDLVGQGYGDGSYSPDECAEMLADFEYVTEEDPAYIAAKAAADARGADHFGWTAARVGLAVSQRNWVRLVVLAVESVLKASA